MKKFSLLFLLISIVCLFIACDNENDPTTEPTLELTDYIYMGKTTVSTDASPFQKDSVWIELIVNNEKSIDLLMKQVAFAERMPKMDILIQGVELETTSKEIKFSGDNIIPTTKGNPVPNFTITNLTGEIINDKVSFSMTAGSYPIEFSGETPKPVVYTGTSSVIQDDGTTFPYKLEIEITLTSNSELTMLLKDAKFAPKMPELSITIKNIPCEINNKEISISGNDIIPEALNGQFPQYIIKDLEGIITNTETSFSMMCGEYPLRFTGKIK